MQMSFLTRAQPLGRILTALAVLGFVLSSLCCPVIPRLAFLHGSFEDNVKLYIGAWGGCLKANGRQTCPPSAFGFHLNLINFPGRTSQGKSPIIADLTYAMILFPLTAFLAFVGVIAHSLSRKRFYQMVGAGCAALALACATVGLVFMFVIFANARHRINEQFVADPATFGPATWLALVSFILLIGGVIFLWTSLTPADRDRNSLSKSHYFTMQSQSEIFKPSFDVPLKKDQDDASFYASEHDFKSSEHAYPIQTNPNVAYGGGHPVYPPQQTQYSKEKGPFAVSPSDIYQAYGQPPAQPTAPEPTYDQPPRRGSAGSTMSIPRKPVTY